MKINSQPSVDRRATGLVLLAIVGSFVAGGMIGILGPFLQTIGRTWPWEHGGEAFLLFVALGYGIWLAVSWARRGAPLPGVESKTGPGSSLVIGFVWILLGLIRMPWGAPGPDSKNRAWALLWVLAGLASLAEYLAFRVELVQGGVWKRGLFRWKRALSYRWTDAPEPVLRLRFRPWRSPVQTVELAVLADRRAAVEEFLEKQGVRREELEGGAGTVPADRLVQAG